MKRKIISVIVLLFLFGCGPYIYFKSPQPEKKKNLEKFPAKIIGQYISASDSSVLIIGFDKIKKIKTESTSMSHAEFMLETGDTIIKDTSFVFTDNWLINVKFHDDSVFINSSREEEIFKVSENQLLRKFKKYYFLNYKDTNDLWKIEILKLTKDTLEFGNILTKEDLEQIKGITSVEEYTDSTDSGKSTKYYLSPARKELKKILMYRTRGEKFVRL